MSRRPGQQPAPEPPEGLVAQNPDEWMQVWRRVITTTPTKAVGYAAAQFADWKTGAEVRPGNEILARICGCSTKSVRRAFTFMRDNGLMFRYHKGVAEGDTDWYRLTVPEDITMLQLLVPDTWAYPPDCESAPDSQSTADCESPVSPATPVDNPRDSPLPTLDPESAVDPVSATGDCESTALGTVSPPTSTRNLYKDLSILANTSPDTAGVEGEEGPARGETRFNPPPKCKTCGGSAQPVELQRNDGTCNWCAPPLGVGLEDPEVVGLVTNHSVRINRSDDAWPPHEPRDAACLPVLRGWSASRTTIPSLPRKDYPHDRDTSHNP
jgi:hypothetical protein